MLKGPRSKLRELHKQLNEVMTGPITDDSLSMQHDLQIKIDDLLEKGRALLGAARKTQLVMKWGSKYCLFS